jgi:hypothetical protein
MSRNAEILFWTDLPVRWLMAAVIPHLAFTVAQGLWRLARGRARPFVLGKIDALKELPTLRSRRQVRTHLARSAKLAPHFPIKLGILDDARHHLKRPLEASRRNQA